MYLFTLHYTKQNVLFILGQILFCTHNATLNRPFERHTRSQNWPSSNLNL